MESIVDDFKWILEFDMKQNNTVIKTNFLTNKNETEKKANVEIRISDLRFSFYL